MATMRERCSDEHFQRLIDAAESVAVVLRDLTRGWPTRELHVPPADALRALQTALRDVGVGPEEVADVFGDTVKSESSDPQP